MSCSKSSTLTSIWLAMIQGRNLSSTLSFLIPFLIPIKNNSLFCTIQLQPWVSIKIFISLWIPIIESTFPLEKISRSSAKQKWVRLILLHLGWKLNTPWTTAALSNLDKNIHSNDKQIRWVLIPLLDPSFTFEIASYPSIKGNKKPMSDNTTPNPIDKENWKL